MKNDPQAMVEKVASDIEKLLAKKRKALSVSDLSFFFWKSEQSHPLNLSLSVVIVTVHSDIFVSTP